MLMLIKLILKQSVPLWFFIWAIFMPKAGSYTFIGLYLAFQAYLFFIDSRKPNPDPSEWSTDEINIIRKYHLVLISPSVANIISAQLSAFRWGSLFLFTPLLILNHMWIAATVIYISFNITLSISFRLNPIFWLEHPVKERKMQFDSELKLLKEVSERLKAG